MSQDFLSFLTTILIMGLFCLGALALIGLSLYFSYRRFRGFTAAVKGKMASWDAFVSRTGLQWELKAPTYNPAMDKLFGSEVANKTGRVTGTYRGYPVVIGNQTRNRYGGPPGMLMVTRQAYYTEFRLTIRNPAAINLRVLKKDSQLTVEPQDVGAYLLGASHSLGRLEQSPVPLGINIQRQELYYLQAGIEQDSDRLYDTLETLCDLADAVGAYR